MSEYWLISAPGDKTCQQTWETLNEVTVKQNNLSVNYKFQIPDLKVRPIPPRQILFLGLMSKMCSFFLSRSEH